MERPLLSSIISPSRASPFGSAHRLVRSSAAVTVEQLLGQNYRVTLFKTLTKDTWPVTSNLACFGAVRWRRIFQRLPKVAVRRQQGRNPLGFDCRHTFGRENTHPNAGLLPGAALASSPVSKARGRDLTSTDLLVSHFSSQLHRITFFCSETSNRLSIAERAGAEQLFRKLSFAPAHSARGRINQANFSRGPDLESIRIQTSWGTTTL